MNAKTRLKLQNELASILQECATASDCSAEYALSLIRRHAEKALAIVNEPKPISCTERAQYLERLRASGIDTTTGSAS